MKKTYISAAELLSSSLKLGEIIIKDGFRPDFIVGVWRGGTPVGIAVQELMDFCHIKTDHIAIRTSSYTGIAEQQAYVKVYGLHYLIENMNHEDRLLILDDVFDSGRSINAIIHELEVQMRKNMPLDVRVGTVYYKPSKNLTTRIPNYFVHKTEDWLIFPHELDGLTDEEITANKPDADMLVRLRRACAKNLY
ncbi:MAG: hypoxanthine phosphoribosyltransferase [Alphaproteobacteria bacterium]|nr:hypoxanthine phosphoribosyltransferase [Alphaproteobacteria bacterium]HPF45287.1 phosphoribosyltransferase family protein [Emcibacteraceae bacterium]HRW28994.1 phosphoribosyltransferase family protein [Emcibacteraceae bacterium]